MAEYWNNVNEWVNSLMVSIRNPILSDIMIFLTNVGGPVGLTAVAVIIVIILWIHNKKHHILQIVLTLAISGAIVWSIKEAIQLPRPIGGLVAARGYSFASGHAAYATIFFSLLAYSYMSHFTSALRRRIFIAAAVVLAFLIGISRVYLGVHYFTDVLAGFLIGIVISFISIKIFNALDRR